MQSTTAQAATVAASKFGDFFKRNVWNHVLDIDEIIWWRPKEKDVDGNVVVTFKFGAIPIGLIAIVAMWLLNLVFDWAGTTGGWKVVSYPASFISYLIGFGGYLAIWRQVAKPRNILFGAFIFATFNALHWRSPVKGAVTGSKTVLDLAGVIGLYYLFTALVLWTWGFSNSPMAFWIGIVAVIVLASLGAGSGIRTWVMTIYAAVVLVMAIWSTFGGSWRGEAFDGCNGKSLYLVDPDTGNVHGKIAPTKCKVKEFSIETGKRLRPMTADEATRRNPFTAIGAYASDAKAALPAAGAGEKARATTICGKDVTWEAPKEERSYPTVRPGCTQRFITSSREQLHLHAMDERLDGEPSKYYVIERPSWELIKITPKKNIPTGMDPVIITLVTTEESIDIKNKIVADDEALKKEAGL